MVSLSHRFMLAMMYRKNFPMALFEAKVLIETWRREYNTIRPHRCFGHKPPTPDTSRPITDIVRKG
jgi:transposase InsO family protein